MKQDLNPTNLQESDLANGTTFQDIPPQAIDTLQERFQLTRSELSEALELGYQITGSTPLFVDGILAPGLLTPSPAEFMGTPFDYEAIIKAAPVSNAIIPAESEFSAPTLTLTFPDRTTSAVSIEQINEHIKLRFSLRGMPNTSTVSAIGICAEDNLIAILLLAVERPDQLIAHSKIDPKDTLIQRLADSSDPLTALQIYERITRELERAQAYLDLNHTTSNGFDLLVNHSGNGCSYSRYLSDNRGERDLITISLPRMYQYEQVLNQDSILRHELCHAFDHWIGSNGVPFSSIYTQELLGIINEFFKDANEPFQVSSYFDLLYQKPFDLLRDTVDEVGLFGGEVYHGHCKSGIKELFASSLNNLLDPRFSGLELNTPAKNFYSRFSALVRRHGRSHGEKYHREKQHREKRSGE